MAARPSELGYRAWWRVLRRVMGESDNRNLGLIAAGVAFYTMLSIFPAIAATIAIWGLVADPQTIASQLEMAQHLLPAGAYGIVEEQVAALIRSTGTTLQLTGIVSILLAVWTARNGVAALIRGLNAIYREEHRKSTIKRYAMAIGLTMLLIGVVIIAFASVVLVPILLNFLTLPFGLEALISAVKWVIVLGVVLFSIGLIYRYGPNRRGARTAWITPGAIFALVTWAAGSIAFSIYLRNFGSLNEVYGSIGAVVALLLWLYLSAQVVLLGALLNAEVELETRRDTTVGASRPAGERKAFVADHIVNSEGKLELADASNDDSQNS
ncbi:YihY/virulence factor BrkB family protein [Roseovarius sp. MMSF_3281]|uniref:YihY/virulence factor BrkB family protein n=1 Tax=Roseovarius sp. MMSF_3281 TaxID=3046694 RepID=UPI00273DAFC2|nr:YihY/virulence factor BrkB family protein [Roseovarius sp. MMSF_3281]